MLYTSLNDDLNTHMKEFDACLCRTSLLLPYIVSGWDMLCPHKSHIEPQMSLYLGNPLPA